MKSIRRPWIFAARLRFPQEHEEKFRGHRSPKPPRMPLGKDQVRQGFGQSLGRDRVHQVTSQPLSPSSEVVFNGCESKLVRGTHGQKRGGIINRYRNSTRALGCIYIYLILFRIRLVKSRASLLLAVQAKGKTLEISHERDDAERNASSICTASLANDSV